MSSYISQPGTRTSLAALLDTVDPDTIFFIDVGLSPTADIGDIVPCKYFLYMQMLKLDYGLGGTDIADLLTTEFSYFFGSMYADATDINVDLNDAIPSWWPEMYWGENDELVISSDYEIAINLTSKINTQGQETNIFRIAGFTTSSFPTYGETTSDNGFQGIRISTLSSQDKRIELMPNSSADQVDPDSIANNPTAGIDISTGSFRVCMKNTDPIPWLNYFYTTNSCGEV